MPKKNPPRPRRRNDPRVRNVVARPRTQIMRKKLIEAIVGGATQVQAGRAAGLQGTDKTVQTRVSKQMSVPSVRAQLAAALDAAGCTVEASAEVIADAHRARMVKAWCSPAGEVTEREYVDHGTRLKAADLAGKFRGVGSVEDTGQTMNIGMLVQIVRKNSEDRGLPQ